MERNVGTNGKESLPEVQVSGYCVSCLLFATKGLNVVGVLYRLIITDVIAVRMMLMKNKMKKMKGVSTVKLQTRRQALA